MTMLVWRVSDGQLIADMAPSNDTAIAWCNVLTWAPDNNIIATSYVQHGPPVMDPAGRYGQQQQLSGFVRVWNVVDSTVRRLNLKIPHRAASLCFSHGGILAMGGFDGSITLVNIHTNEVLSRTLACKGIVHRICFSPDGSALLSTGSGGADRFDPGNRGSELKCWKIPEEHTFAHALKLVSGALAPHLAPPGLHTLVASFLW